MVAKSHFQVIILFLLSLLYITSSYTHTQADFDKWVSRNVKNYQKRNILEAKLKVAAPGPDLKLTQAENNKTITEALNSIPPRNTRRVIVSIAPGVYSICLRKDVPECNCGVDASHFVAINIKFEGSQDTLYDHKGLHYFNNCSIQGPFTRKVASITAQKRTNSSLESGFSFKNCTVIGSGQVYLGRAWGDYSRVVFSYTFMDNIVLAKGWSDWGDQKRDSRVYYGEYKCSGPGANLAGRVPWTRVLTDEEAKPFIEMQFIEGDTWLISP
uniref:pectinesterase n=1 Tax=Glycine max TaxID=3847 RepID=A0A0R0HMQ9_SOYBN